MSRVGYLFQLYKPCRTGTEPEVLIITCLLGQSSSKENIKEQTQHSSMSESELSSVLSIRLR